MAAHRCSSFAQKQLEKHGWQTGQGLGRTESGISEAIKVKIKHDTAGVGHDLGEQFTYHWWDHVFNKAANNIVVENNQEGVKLTSKETSHGPISNRKQSKNAGKKPLLYGSFVRSATLTTEGLQQDDQDSSSSEEEESNTEEMNIDDKFFKACGGRTAHKGARHGLTLSGKLKRIQEQEEGYPNRQNKKHQAQSAEPSPTHPDKYQSQRTEDDVDEEKLRDAGGEGHRERKRQKKDKKRRMKASIDNGRCDNDGTTLYIARDENDWENVLQESGKAPEKEKKHKTKKEDYRCDEDDESDRQQVEKQRKKDRKRNKEELGKSAKSCHDDTTDLGDTMVITIDEDVERKRAKKARRELKLKNRQDGASCGENLNGPFVNDAVDLTQEENGGDQNRKHKRKKEKRRKMVSVDVCENENNKSSEPICNSVPEGDTRNGGDELGKKTKKRRKEELLQNGSHRNEYTDIKTSKKPKKKKSKH